MYADIEIKLGTPSLTGPISSVDDIAPADVLMPTQPIEYYKALLPGAPDCPTSLLTRVYDFSSSQVIGWSTGQAAGWQLLNVDIWSLFINSPNGTLLKRYRYLRSGSRFELRINTNSFFYGQLIMYWTPENDTPYYYRQAAATPHVLINANGDLSAAINIPYFNSKPFIDQRVDGPGSMGYLTVMVLSPLRCINVANSADALLFSLVGNMENPVVDGPMAV